MKIGAQLYTVREYTKTLEDFALTLEKVADLGYKSVQVSGTCAFTAEWLDAQLKKNGLTCEITHSPFDKMMADPKGVLDFHQRFGCSCLGLGWYGDIAKEEGLVKFFSEVNPTARAIRAAGGIFSYHNHSTEFYKINGKSVMQTLAEGTDPEAVFFTLDCYWVQNAGGDPAKWLQDLSGRVPYIHLKDMAMSQTDSHTRFMAPVGQGNMNYERILSAAEAAGTKVGYVEQDDCYGADPFTCLKTSIDYLRALGLSD